MADVFVSYARKERSRAEVIKACLEAAGLSVFLDVDGLDGGDVFPDVLDREVKSAGAVLALWSPHALSRPWIKQECAIGLRRKVLIPATIEPLGELDVPVAFEGLQHVDLTSFHGDISAPEWRRLLKSLARTLKRPDLAANAASIAESSTSRLSPQARDGKGGWGAAVAILVFLAAVGAGGWAFLRFTRVTPSSPMNVQSAALIEPRSQTELPAVGDDSSEAPENEAAEGVDPPEPALVPLVASERERIAEAQALLNDMGYDAGPADGEAGRRTSDAVEQFRRAVGLGSGQEINDDLLAALRLFATQGHRAPTEEEASPDVVLATAPPSPASVSTTPARPTLIACSVSQDIARVDQGSNPRIQFNNVTLPPEAQVTLDISDAERGELDSYIVDLPSGRWQRRRVAASLAGDLLTFGAEYRNASGLLLWERSQIDLATMSGEGEALLHTSEANGPRLWIDVRNRCSYSVGSIPDQLAQQPEWMVTQRRIPTIPN